MTVAIRSLLNAAFALAMLACSRGRTDRAPDLAGTVAAVPSAGTSTVLPTATVDASAGVQAAARDPDLDTCGSVKRQLRLVGAWRGRPGELFGGKAMLCGQYSPAHVCSRTGSDDDGFIGVGFSTTGPGALFHFEFPAEEGARRRLTCESIGLARAMELERGAERCARVEKGALRKMIIVLDSRCDELRLTAFDDDYLARDPDAAHVLPCTESAPERLAAPPLACGLAAIIRDDR